MKKTFLIFSFMLLVLFGKSQTDDEILFNAKLNTIDYHNIIISEKLFYRIPEILQDTFICNAKFIESRGFDDIYFIKVNYADGIISFINIYDLENSTLQIIKDTLNTICSNNYLDLKFEFILAYDGRRYYKLQGFVENDFEQLFNIYRLKGQSKLLKNKKYFLNNFYIEGMDMICIYYAYIKYKKDFLKYPCLQAVKSRMIIEHGIPFVY